MKQGYRRRLEITAGPELRIQPRLKSDSMLQHTTDGKNEARNNSFLRWHRRPPIIYHYLNPDAVLRRVRSNTDHETGYVPDLLSLSSLARFHGIVYGPIVISRLRFVSATSSESPWVARRATARKLCPGTTYCHLEQVVVETLFIIELSQDIALGAFALAHNFLLCNTLYHAFCHFCVPGRW